MGLLESIYMEWLLSRPLSQDPALLPLPALLWGSHLVPCRRGHVQTGPNQAEGQQALPSG